MPFAIFHYDPNALSTDSEYSPPASPEKSKPRQSKAKASILSEPEDIPDSEEDLGHFQSQQFLAQTRKALKQTATRRTDGYADKFKADVEEKKRSLTELLESRSGDFLAQRTKGHVALTALLFKNLKYKVLTTTDAVSTRRPQSIPTVHPLQQKAESLLNISKELLKTYDKASQEIAAYGDTLQVGEDWEADCQRLQYLLGVGKQVAENRVRRMVLNQGEDLKMEGLKGETRVKDEKRWAELAEVGSGGDDGESWALVAGRIQKRVSRLVKGLPEGDEL
ncbi:hypothetical protein MMC30_003503 [Trapelia coarctata]|nr:hypothetical protein [Trapelia coarctata]